MPVSRETIAAVIALLAWSPAASAAGASAAGASAMGASGNAALALAALVAARSPLLPACDKQALSSMLDGKLDFVFPAGRKIWVQAGAVTCRGSTVDIAAHDCTLRFGTATVGLTGRAAHELFATIAEAGVPSEGAAGSIFESFAHLNCTIDPNAVKERAGGGGDCHFDSGAP
jgi:hypothetical protein